MPWISVAHLTESTFYRWNHLDFDVDAVFVMKHRYLCTYCLDRQRLPIQNSPLLIQIAPHLRDYFGLRRGLFHTNWGGYFGSYHYAIHSRTMFFKFSLFGATTCLSRATIFNKMEIFNDIMIKYLSKAISNTYFRYSNPLNWEVLTALSVNGM